MLPDTAAQGPQQSPTPKLTVSKVGTAMIPFTPVSFSDDPALAYLRLGAYGAVAFLLWKKNKTLSYTAMIAAGTCAITSMSSMVWSKA